MRIRGSFKSNSQTHCGACSQCIDRRIAVIASGQVEHDPAIDYCSDVFTGLRKEGYETNMAVDYARHAIELNKMTEENIAARFSAELSRAIRPFEKHADAMDAFIAMHKRHGRVVQVVIEQQVGKYVSNLVGGELPETSMLCMVVGNKHSDSSWKRFADRIVDMLSVGLPRACHTHKPKNEPQLQTL